jgi:nucleoside-diphosphate-sugar epimerase
MILNSNSKILVIGYRDFVGSRLVPFLRTKGFQVNRLMKNEEATDIIMSFKVEVKI